jgi:hypothetical protein
VLSCASAKFQEAEVLLAMHTLTGSLRITFFRVKIEKDFFLIRFQIPLVDLPVASREHR